MPLHGTLLELPAQAGTAFALLRGQVLRIVAVEGEQVADVALFSAADVRDAFSPGRTIDYNERLRPALGDLLYSNRSTPLARIVEDTVGVHDVLLAPCSEAMFLRRGEASHPSCHSRLSRALEPFGIGPDAVVSTINVFMDVRIEGQGLIRIYPPPSHKGDSFALRAACDLIVGISACCSELTNNGTCKPIAYRVDESKDE